MYNEFPSFRAVEGLVISLIEPWLWDPLREPPVSAEALLRLWNCVPGRAAGPDWRYANVRRACSIPTRLQDLYYTVLRWFDSWAGLEYMKTDDIPKMDWLRCIPLIAVHGCAWALSGSAGVGPPSQWRRHFISSGCLRITGWYHRYFSHRTFKTSRACPVCLCGFGRLLRSTRPALVGRPSPPSPHRLRQPR